MKQLQWRKKNKESVMILGPANMILPTPTYAEGVQMKKSERRSEIQLLKSLTSYRDDSRHREGLPKADSLQIVLEQALHSRDKKLLGACLDVVDPEIVKNTVQRLNPATIVAFTQELVKRFQAKPNQGIILTVWLRSVLSNHASYLTTIPDLVTILSSLYLSLDNRLSSFNKLLQLHGRLDLVLEQVSKTEKPVPISTQKVTVYEEPDDVEQDLLSKDEEQSMDKENSSESEDNDQSEGDDKDSEEEDDRDSEDNYKSEDAEGSDSMEE